MAYFPAFINLNNKSVLIIGGGDIASRKLKKLLDFTTNIKIIAPIFSPIMEKLIEDNNLIFEKRVYKRGDISSFEVVIIAINDILLQKEIYLESKKYPKCICNSVDNIEYCDFIFPSYIKEDELIIAISTSGISPAFTKQLRIYLQKLIPNSIKEFLKEMKNYRDSMPKGRERMMFLDKKAKEFIKKGLK